MAVSGTIMHRRNRLHRAIFRFLHHELGQVRRLKGCLVADDGDALLHNSKYAALIDKVDVHLLRINRRSHSNLDLVRQAGHFRISAIDLQRHVENHSIGQIDLLISALNSQFFLAGLRIGHYASHIISALRSHRQRNHAVAIDRSLVGRLLNRIERKRHRTSITIHSYLNRFTASDISIAVLDGARIDQRRHDFLAQRYIGRIRLVDGIRRHINHDVQRSIRIGIGALRLSRINCSIHRRSAVHGRRSSLHVSLGISRSSDLIAR